MNDVTIHSATVTGGSYAVRAVSSYGTKMYEVYEACLGLTRSFAGWLFATEKTASEVAKRFNTNDANTTVRYLVACSLPAWVEPEAYSVVAVNSNGHKRYRIVRHSDEAQDFWVYWDPELAAAAAADFLTRPIRFGKTANPLPAWEEPEGYSICKVRRKGEPCYAVVRHSDEAMDALTFAIEDGAVYLAEFLLQGGGFIKGDPYPAWEEPRPSTCGPGCPTCHNRRAGYL